MPLFQVFQATIFKPPEFDSKITGEGADADTAKIISDTSLNFHRLVWASRLFRVHVPDALDEVARQRLLADHFGVRGEIGKLESKIGREEFAMNEIDHTMSLARRNAIFSELVQSLVAKNDLIGSSSKVVGDVGSGGLDEGAAPMLCERCPFIDAVTEDNLGLIT